jgi:hypothetical protein
MIEDTDHILKCKGNEKYRQITQEFLKNLSYNLRQLHTNETVIRVFMSFISAWLLDEPTPDLHQLVDDPSIVLIEAIYSQTLLGWGEIFRGRLVLSWATLYNHDIINDPLIPNHHDSEVWGKKVLQLAWEYVFNMWETRNDIEHNSNGDPSKEIKRKLILKIMWNIKNFSQESAHPYKSFEDTELMELPLANLQMIDVQAEQFRLWDKNKQKNSEVEENIEDNN